MLFQTFEPTSVKISTTYWYCLVKVQLHRTLPGKNDSRAAKTYIDGHVAAVPNVLLSIRRFVCVINFKKEFNIILSEKKRPYKGQVKINERPNRQNGRPPFSR